MQVRRTGKKKRYLAEIAGDRLDIHISRNYS